MAVFLSIFYLLCLGGSEPQHNVPTQAAQATCGKRNAAAKAQALLLLAQAERQRDQASRAGYAEAVAKSAEEGTVLILVVGTSRPDLATAPWAVIHVQEGDHQLPVGIVVSRGGAWLVTLPANAAIKTIAKILRPTQTTLAPQLRVASRFAAC